MADHGYSGTPLARKLGIDAGSRILIDRAPAGWQLPDPPPRLLVHRRAGTGPYDVILAFCRDTASLHARFRPLAGVLTVPGALWICWPKRSSGVVTDLTEAVVREFGLGARLVDVKVCAVDTTWSGLKFVRRLRDR